MVFAFYFLILTDFVFDLS